MTRLQALKMHAFRGITDLTLDFHGGSVVLGGGNGTGKSACVDAIEFLYTGSIGPLTGTQSLGLRQHGAHIRAAPGESVVSASYTEPAGTVIRRLSGAIQSPPELEPHLARGSQLSFILRRSQLHYFIHAKPADRYHSMAELLGLESLERTEAGLKRARDEAERESSQAQIRLAEVRRKMETLPDDAPEDEQILWEANAKLDTLGIDAYRLNSLDDVERVRLAVLRDIGARKPDARDETEVRLLAELTQFAGPNRLAESAAAYLNVAKSESEIQQRHLLELLQLLRSGREYVRQVPEQHCPLCEQAMPGNALLARLLERVGDLEEVSVREEQLRVVRQDLATALEDTVNRLQRIQLLLASAGRDSPAAHLIDACTMLVESSRTGTVAETREMADRLQEALDRWSAWAPTAVAGLTQTIERRREVESDQKPAEVMLILEEIGVRRAQRAATGQERRRLETESQDLHSAIRKSGRVLAMADTVYQTYLRVKNTEIQRIFDELREDLARMYEFLHPGEGHGTVSIALDPRKRGSSELKMGFYDRPAEDPRAYASEGHLDSLGLCIFLAFAQRFNAGWPLLVLDDVVTSVDFRHKERVAQLLYTEFADRQMLITTHDARWFLDLQKAQRETGNTSTTNLVIESWSLETGPRLKAEVLNAAGN